MCGAAHLCGRAQTSLFPKGRCGHRPKTCAAIGGRRNQVPLPECLLEESDVRRVVVDYGDGDESAEIAQNDLGEMSLASPAVDGTSLFIRT
jgi:hypothetical protein